ncbi:MAG: P1 family peptidase [Thermoanaerobacteraceae bacterium]|nr:P1 family peptidase [Thermoanaerobacteraceae bacterium]
MYDAITDVEDIKVGHSTDFIALKGCTVVLFEEGCVGGVDVRGGAPGTREIALLNPVAMMDKVNGIMLAGGSAFGLEAACGAMDFLEEHGIGFDVGITKVPIIPSAVLFDLPVGNFKSRPNKSMGYDACKNAKGGIVEEGCVGAGVGATVGKVLGMENCMKSGLGTASIKVNNLIVGAIVAVNAFGDVYDDTTGEIVAGALKPDRSGFADTIKLYKEGISMGTNPFAQNTTIGVIATNAKLNKAEINKVAQMAHDGYARVIRPVHTMFDGDTIFSLATGMVEADVTTVGILAADVMAKAIIKGVKMAKSMGGYPSYRDLIFRKEDI